MTYCGVFFHHTYLFICIDFKKVKKDNALKLVDVTNSNLSDYDTDESSEKCKTILINTL